jgi:hypothetical protein
MMKEKQYAACLQHDFSQNPNAAELRKMCEPLQAKPQRYQAKLLIDN